MQLVLSREKKQNATQNAAAAAATARKKGGQLGKGSLKSFKYPSFFVFSPVFRVQSSFSLSLCSALVATDMQSI
jgi:hypothetical protein